MEWEILVFEDRDFFFFTNFVKVVHVELPDKGWEFFVFEIFREDLVFEEVLVLDDEAAAVISPFDDMTIPPVF
jgi:hypothetical protein